METDVKSLAMKVLEGHSSNLTDKAKSQGVRPDEAGVEVSPEASSLTVSQSHALGNETETMRPLGDARGYLTVDDLPELEQRLRLSGWKVERRFDTLFCWSRFGRKPGIQ